MPAEPMPAEPLLMGIENSHARTAIVVGVVIPFFQREKGILVRALRSVAAQRLPDDVLLKVIVVDDGSPLPVAEAIEDFRPVGNVELQVLAQDNAGPGAARNRALASLSSAPPDFVAFLDSDDVWQPGHIADALRALDAGSGFYFCNHTRFDQPGDWFSQEAVLRPWMDNTQRQALPQAQPAASPEWITFDKSYLLSSMIQTYACQTSTAVFRWRGNEAMRFDPELRGAGEDQLAFLWLAHLNRTVVSLKTNVHCDRGVNMFCGAFSWENALSADRYGHLVIFFDKLAGQSFLAGLDRTRVLGDRVRVSRAYSFLFFRALLMRSKPSLKVLSALFRRSPLTVLMMPFRFVSVLPRRQEESRSW